MRNAMQMMKKIAAGAMTLAFVMGFASPMMAAKAAAPIDEENSYVS